MLGELLGEVGERQHPVAGLAPRPARRVEAVGEPAGVVGHEDAGAAGVHRVGVDEVASVVGVVHERRRVQRPPAPVLDASDGVVVGAQEDLETVPPPALAAHGVRVHDVQALADGEGERRELGSGQGGQGADGEVLIFRVAHEAAARAVDGDYALVLKGHEPDFSDPLRQDRRAQLHHGARQATGVMCRRRISSSSAAAAVESHWCPLGRCTEEEARRVDAAKGAAAVDCLDVPHHVQEPPETHRAARQGQGRRAGLHGADEDSGRAT